MEWTDERISELTKLWNDGLSTAEIGKMLGISKNAVVGKAHRLRRRHRWSPARGSRSPPCSCPTSAACGLSAIPATATSISAATAR
jgi:GcrA cell cycle regulator